MPSTVTLADLIDAPSEADIATLQFDFLEAAEFPVSAWPSKSAPRGLVGADAKAVAELWAVVAQIAAGGYLRLAKGPWLTLLVESNYDDERKPSVVAQRALTLRNDSGSPLSFNLQDWVFQTSGALLFRNSAPVGVDPTTGPFTIAPGASVDLVIVAQEPGVAYNAVTPAWSLVTSVPGLTIVGEAVWADAVSGANEESDPELVGRMVAKLGRIAAGGNTLFYTWHALNISPEVRRVKVRDAYPLPSSITIHIGGESGPISSDVVAALQALLRPSAHDGIGTLLAKIYVSSFVNRSIALVGTLYAVDKERDAAKAAFEAELLKYQTALQGGARIPYSRLIQVMMSQLSLDDRNRLADGFTVDGGAEDVLLSANEIAVFTTTGLVWQSVS